MSSLEAIQAEAPEVLEAQSAATIVRDLALAADRYLLAGKQNDCIALIARIYDLLDDLEQALQQNTRPCRSKRQAEDGRIEGPGFRD